MGKKRYTCNRWIRSSICFNASSCFPRFFIAFGRIDGFEPGRGWTRTGSLGSSCWRLAFKSPLLFPFTFFSSWTLLSKSKITLFEFKLCENQLLDILVWAFYWVFNRWNPKRSATNLGRHVVMRCVSWMRTGRLLGCWPSTQKYHFFFHFAARRTPHMGCTMFLIFNRQLRPSPS